ncbi:MAG: choice-of-anchor L domain-containing protein, partial [Chloroflexi bacterium]|nr:choice-of-anchor L domain-containing protein [Chloroflexota bacterium]
SPEGQAAAALGHAVTVVDDATWSSMTAAQFAAYRAIILGDPTCVGPGASPSINAAAANAGVWGPQITGNVIINGTDPVYHGSLLTGKSVAFAVDEPDKTGAYISLSCYYHDTMPGTPVPVLNAFSPGGFTVMGVGCYNNAHIVASHPALAGLTDATLSNWSCSVHEAFDKWPLDFAVLAIAQDIGSSYTASDGTVGTPYILARGEKLVVISDIKLEPKASTNPVGSSHTVTATVMEDAAPKSGVTVTFKVVDGPNEGKVGTGVTNASGQASFSYVGTTPGKDYIVASFVDSAGATQSSDIVTKDWIEIVGVTITAHPIGCDPLVVILDPSVIENAAPGSVVFMNEFIHVPPGTPPGEYSCIVEFRADGVPFAKEAIIIEVAVPGNVTPPEVHAQLEPGENIIVDKLITIPGKPPLPPVSETFGTQERKGDSGADKVAAESHGSLETKDLSAGPTPADLVNALLGAGIPVSGITYTGVPASAGFFSHGTGIVGPEGGIILSSGGISNVIGPNGERGITLQTGTPGDSQLDILAGFPTYDATVLEFDFIPSTNVISFEYVFGSDEYNEWVGSEFNDVFAFYVNGVNCAVLPGGAPVSINTVNAGHGGFPPVNPGLYINNDPFDDPIAPSPLRNTEMDGLTKVLGCEAVVAPGVKNHIKLAIADASDRILDSNVFIKAGSFKDTPLPDKDGDKVPDVFDNCPDTPNTDQADKDKDGVGDACEVPVDVVITYVPVGCAPLQISFEPKSLKGMPGEAVNMKETITVPPGTPPGVVECYVSYRVNGVEFFQQKLVIEIVAPPAQYTTTGQGTLFTSGGQVKTSFWARVFDNGRGVVTADGQITVFFGKGMRFDGNVRMVEPFNLDKRIGTYDGAAFAGEGSINKLPGYSFYAESVDTGAPGSGHDLFGVVIYGPDSSEVLTASHNTLALGDVKANPSPNLIRNGGFESGSFGGWQVASETSYEGGWAINDGAFDPPGPAMPVTPYDGNFSAESWQTGPGLQVLSQEVHLPGWMPAAYLSWADKVQNWAGGYSDPSQEFRVLLMAPDGTVLEQVFSTNPGDPSMTGWAFRVVDVSKYIGKTIRVAFVAQETDFFMNVHVDNVAITVVAPSGTSESAEEDAPVGTPDGGAGSGDTSGGTPDGGAGSGDTSGGTPDGGAGSGDTSGGTPDGGAGSGDTSGGTPDGGAGSGDTSGGTPDGGAVGDTSGGTPGGEAGGSDSVATTKPEATQEEQAEAATGAANQAVAEAEAVKEELTGDSKGSTVVAAPADSGRTGDEEEEEPQPKKKGGSR